MPASPAPTCAKCDGKGRIHTGYRHHEEHCAKGDACPAWKPCPCTQAHETLFAVERLRALAADMARVERGEVAAVNTLNEWTDHTPMIFWPDLVTVLDALADAERGRNAARDNCNAICGPELYAVHQQRKQAEAEGNAARKDAAALRAALRGLLGIVNESSGVDGFHLNGDIAAWGEFPEVESAEAALDAAGKEGA